MVAVAVADGGGMQPTKLDSHTVMWGTKKVVSYSLVKFDGMPGSIISLQLAECGFC